MSENTSQAVNLDAVNTVKGTPKDPKNLSLEQLSLLVLTGRLNHLQQKSQSEFKELRIRQEQVSDMHKVLKSINSNTNEKGEFVFEENDQWIAHFEKAKSHGMEIPTGKKGKDGKTTISKGDRERFIENIRMTVEDLNIQNDMQIQTVTRLTNERHEAFHMARAIMKPLHDDKVNKARAVAGR